MSLSKGFTRMLLAAAACLLATATLAATKTDHKSYRDAKLDDCQECHRAEGVADNHGAFFLRDHRGLAQKASSNCNDCHQQSYCLDCHNGGNVDASQKSLSRRGETAPVSHRTDFISTHPMKAADEPQSCTRCHNAQDCSDCHTKQTRGNVAGGRAALQIKPHKPVFSAPGVPDPSWVAFHRSEAKRNLQSCQSCHPAKADCTNFACHPGLRGR
jgi:hypothetical protein